MEQFQSSILELIKFQIQSQKELHERQIKNEEKYQQQILELKENNDKKQLEISELIRKAISAKENNSDEKFCSQNIIWSTIEIFDYNPEEDQTFERFYQKYQDFFDIDGQTWTNEKKIRLLLSKLGTNEHNKFTDFILPKKTRDLKFNEAIELLKELFNPRLSLFHKRWKCLNIQKYESEDFTTYASVINKECDDFRLSELIANNFKCLIFVLGQVSKKR